jgi:hypothetical protein
LPDWLANWTFQTVKAGGALVVAEAEAEAVVAFKAALLSRAVTV